MDRHGYAPCASLRKVDTIAGSVRDNGRDPARIPEHRSRPTPEPFFPPTPSVDARATKRKRRSAWSTDAGSSHCPESNWMRPLKVWPGGSNSMVRNVFSSAERDSALILVELSV